MRLPEKPQISVLGSGSWGTALACLLGRNGHKTTIVGRDEDAMAAINSDRCNRRYLPDCILPHEVSATADFAAVKEGDVLLLVVPTSAFRASCEKLAEVGLPSTTVLICCSKGIERETGERMSEIAAECLPDNPLAVLSGPNHAEEVSKALATCAVVASADSELAEDLQHLFSNDYFRCYRQDDLAGIELGGAIKNVFAIAAGIADGLGLGDNAVSALVTRGLAEMIRLGTRMGGKMETFIGLSGVGDLVATCYSSHSRNNRVGLHIGRDKMSKDEAVAALGMVAEGVPNTLSIYETAQRLQVRTPLIEAVHSILYSGAKAQDVLHKLLTRDAKHEAE